MNGAIFVLAINIALSLVMASAFFAVARFDRANRPALWFAAAFGFASISYIGEYALILDIGAPFARMAIAVSILITLMLVAHALAVRYGVALSVPGSVAAVAAAGVLYFLILDLPRADFVRQVLYQLPYALASLLAIWVLARAHTRKSLEWSVMAFFALLAAYFMAKPLIAQWTGGVGERPDAYASTLYAAISQSSGAILILVLAIGALGMVARDSASALIRRNERDDVTGLLTQHGFETHARRSVRAASGDPQPDMGLILIAGQGASGPVDIEQSARLVGDVIVAKSGPDAVLGRMGPLEFAMLLPEHNLFASRRVAMAVRDSIGVEKSTRLSIGITEREPSDSLADMLARALWALEEARHAGGDCIRLSVRSGMSTARHG